MSKFIFHYKRADVVLLSLIQSYRDKDYLYRKWHADKGVAPQQKNIPTKVSIGSIEHRIFLYFTVLVTLQSVSEIGFQSCVRMYDEDQKIFSPQLMTMKVTDVAVILKRYGINKPQHWANYWHHCGVFLYRELQGDPLNLFNFFQTIGDFVTAKKVKELYLPGYGPKLMSLLALFFEELGLITAIDDAIPIDVHHQRVCITTGIVSTANKQDQFIDAALLAEFLREKLSLWIKKYGITPFESSHAMFLLGSKVCTRCQRMRRINSYCPITSLCSGSIPTRSYWKKGKWDLFLERHQKGHPQEEFILNNDV